MVNMSMKYYRASLIGTAVILFLTLLLGATLGLVFVEKWSMPTGETVALILATGAFTSSFYHFYTQRRHQRLSVKPYFQISSRFDSVTKDGFYTFRVFLKNTGLGPGKVTSKSMKLGEAQTNDVHDEFEEWVKLVNRITPANGNAECQSGRCEAGYGIDNGESIDLLLVSFPQGHMSFMDTRDVAMELGRNVEIIVGYESMYGESYECIKKTT